MLFQNHKKKLSSIVKNKNILITGASSGIGYSLAKQLAKTGAHVQLMARREDLLEQLRQEILEEGGKASVYVCDLNNLDEVEQVATKILQELGHVDILVNNAGRSIRRAVNESVDRFHDFERTMQLNYLGAVRLTLTLLPNMISRKKGHIINVSSIGVLANPGRFSAYIASKSALDGFGKCLAAEVYKDNIAVSSIYMPLVRTPMIAPTDVYKKRPALTPDQAAELIIKAILKRPKHVITKFGLFTAFGHTIMPKVSRYIMAKEFEMYPSSEAAVAKKSE